MLSKYIVESFIGEEKILFDTTQKKSLPINSDEETLRKSFFLEGQENEALNHALFGQKPTYLVINVNPTWKCNLRCTHCCVLHRLVKEETVELDAQKLLAFAKSHQDRYGTKRFYFRFAGGEPLLATAKLKELLDVFEDFAASTDSYTDFSMTTNLALDLSEEEFSVMERFNLITVSLDGLEDAHNAQRKDVDRSLNNPFRRTILNLKQLMLKGWREKIHVQAAVKEEHFKDIAEYYRTLLRIGVLHNHIKYACIHPTERNKEANQSFIDVFRSHTLFPRPCCKYQCMSNFTVDNLNKVYTDFYIFKEIGTLDDSMEFIETRSKDSILSEMPVLKDPKCQQCPVIGYCWGGCSMGNLFWEENPSKYCDQKLLIKKVAESANLGQIDAYGDTNAR